MPKTEAVIKAMAVAAAVGAIVALAAVGIAMFFLACLR